MKPYKALWLVVGIVCSLSLGSSPSWAGNTERLEILQNAPVTLSRAMEIALAKYPGYALRGKLKEQDGMFYYQIALVTGEGQEDVYIHPVNGLVIGTENEMSMARRLQQRWESRLDVVSHSALSALDVMSIAHKVATGRILEIDLKRNHRGQFFYRVMLYEGYVKHVIDINVKTGEIINHEVATS